MASRIRNGEWDGVVSLACETRDADAAKAGIDGLVAAGDWVRAMEIASGAMSPAIGRYAEDSCANSIAADGIASVIAVCGEFRARRLVDALMDRDQKLVERIAGEGPERIAAYARMALEREESASRRARKA
jgi:hypothetical protein